MVGRKRKIVWNETAKQFFKEVIIYIRKSSPQNADKVKSGILKAIRELAGSPEIYSPDKFKENNTNHQFRAFEKFSFRVSYFVSANEIRIVRIRHVKQMPKMY